VNPAAFSWVLYRDGQPTALRIARADRLLGRLRGLLGSTELSPANGLWLSPCNSIHTAFMRYAIDVVFMASDGRVVAVRGAIGPWRLAWGGRRAHHALEVALGVANRNGLVPGVRLRLAAPGGHPE
jgi:uncharacterized membrane protein (UPF0127 family)